MVMARKQVIFCLSACDLKKSVLNKMSWALRGKPEGSGASSQG